MTNKPTVQVVITGADLILIAIFTYLAIAGSTLCVVAAVLVIVGFFINPRWSKSTGWRFKHDQ